MKKIVKKIVKNTKNETYRGVKGKTKYIYQKYNHHPYQCGPYAIYNLLIRHARYYDLTKIIRLCKATPRYGTLCKTMDATLIKINQICDVDIKSIEPTYNSISDTVKKDGAVILLFHWQDAFAATDKDAFATSGDHYAMIESFDNNKFKVINYSFDEEVKYISCSGLKTMMIRHKNEEFNEVYPKAWSL